MENKTKTFFDQFMQEIYDSLRKKYDNMEFCEEIDCGDYVYIV